jgi:hypothetical protein
MHDALHDKGLVGLAYYELGFRQITNSLRPIHTVADLQGLKLRVIPTPLNIDWVKALGAQAVPIPFPDVAALETKAVDGQDNPVTVIDANRFDRVQKYLLLSRHQYNPQSVLISKRSGTASTRPTDRCSPTLPASRPRSSAAGRAAWKARRSRTSGNTAWSSPGCPMARHARWPTCCARSPTKP